MTYPMKNDYVGKSLSMPTLTLHLGGCVIDVFRDKVWVYRKNHFTWIILSYVHMSVWSCVICCKRWLLRFRCGLFLVIYYELLWLMCALLGLYPLWFGVLYLEFITKMLVQIRFFFKKVRKFDCVVFCGGLFFLFCFPIIFVVSFWMNFSCEISIRNINLLYMGTKFWRIKKKLRLMYYLNETSFLNMYNVLSTQF